MKVIFLPHWMIESGEARREFPTFAIERSVLYLYGIDWIYHYHDCCEWCRLLDARRN